MARSNLTDFEIEVIFDRIWEIYEKINSDKKPSAFKAFQLELKIGSSWQEIEHAVKIYALESKGDEFHYQLGNFLRDKRWQDIIDIHTDLSGYLRHLENLESQARHLIHRWNDSCRSHWCPVLDAETKIPLAKKALANDAFKENWERALKLAEGIFRRPMHSTDMRSKITLSFRWFTTLGDKMTVMRLVEREYGSPEVSDPKGPIREPEKELTEEDKKKIRDLFRDVFGDNFQP